MILQKQRFTDRHPDLSYLPYEKEKLLFFDIETTGFSPKTSALYLIGAVYFSEQSWNCIQWLAESSDEEPRLLQIFFDFCASFRVLIHFNGEGFDIPYLLQKAGQYNLSAPFNAMESVDLYRRIRPCKAWLKLTCMNQKAMETFLDIHRKDKYTGGELIEIYQRFTKDASAEDRHLLLLHNQDDLTGMTGLLPLLAYPALFLEHRYVLKDVSWMDTPNGQPMLLIELTLENPIPKPVSCRLSYGYLSAHNQVCRLQIRAFEGELKYFLPDYRNYYFLPDQDCAIHKSIAAYTNPAKRIQAKASHCYLRRYGLFLPQKTTLFNPVFQKDYKSPDLWFECTEQFMNTPSQLFLYIKSLISN